jgi:hypothetical protein
MGERALLHVGGQLWGIGLIKRPLHGPTGIASQHFPRPIVPLIGRSDLLLNQSKSLQANFGRYWLILPAVAQKWKSWWANGGNVPLRCHFPEKEVLEMWDETSRLVQAITDSLNDLLPVTVTLFPCL